MDYVPVVLSVALVILTIVLTVVGVQLMIVLAEVRRTFKKVNSTIDAAEQRLNALVTPLQNLGGMASGVKTGIKVFEAFVGWLNKNKE